ncbi:MAG: DUF2304 domain-containing protein [Actinomyces sp.]|uniref:DUF2304 domain-containing protein n=1 Tax=Actinomyces sp. TaxID=29317 RepID=UPI0026DCA477|nr:DUF2304 domain-containing protein [Actinomyces sp.]MDO4242252.1 DUF2304 domain-containing protein [Actinomyces sp.]
MLTRVFFILVAVAIMLFVIGLLRSRKLREKYAALWILVGLAIVVLAVVPDLLGALAGFLDIQVPSNLLFALAIFLLLGVALHLSLEISRLEDETRVLAENIAVLDLVVREAGLTSSLEGDQAPPEDPRPPERPDNPGPKEPA